MAYKDVGKFWLNIAETCSIIGEHLGQGKSFSVYKFHIPENLIGTQFYPPSPTSIAVLKRPVVLETRIRLARSTGSDFGMDHQSIRDIALELRCLLHSPLSNHRNIIKLIGIGWETDGWDSRIRWPVPILEYADLGNLSVYQKQNPLLSYETKRELCLDVARALLVLHNCDVTHGDVNAKNILVFSNPQGGVTAKLADFGCAVLAADSRSLLLGTEPWKAPEWKNILQTENFKLTDVYSFGLLVWHVMMDGKKPFDDLVDQNGSRQAIYNRIQRLKLNEEFTNIVKTSIEAYANLHRDIDVTKIKTVIEHTIQKDSANRNLMAAAVALNLYISLLHWIKSLDVLTPTFYQKFPL